MEQFKVVVLGSETSGKTSMLKQYTQGSFPRDYIKTLGAQYSKYNAVIKKHIVNLFFWDISSNEEFLYMRPAFYRGTKAAIIVFSLKDKKSFEDIEYWYKDIRDFFEDVPIIIMGNASDLEEDRSNQAVDNDKIEGLMKKLHILGFFKFSLTKGNDVHEAFHTLINELYTIYRKN